MVGALLVRLDAYLTLMNWTGGIANPKWKDNQTMLNKETIPQWQAYVPGFARSQAFQSNQMTDTSTPT